MSLDEEKQLAEGRTTVIYHHNSRYKGGHKKEIQDWMSRLGKGTLALRWKPFSSRTFFILNPDETMKDKLVAFEKHWGAKAQLFFSE